jgi:hypothetical protein
VSILSLFQTVLPQLQTSEGGWSTRQHKLRDYREEKLEGDDELSRFRIVTSPKGKCLLREMTTTPQLYKRYQNYIDQSAEIIKTIDTLYPEQAGAKAH